MTLYTVNHQVNQSLSVVNCSSSCRVCGVCGSYSIVTQVMAQFKSGELRILVATDVAARGLDVKDIQVIIIGMMQWRPIFVFYACVVFFFVPDTVGIICLSSHLATRLLLFLECELLPVP